MCAEKKVVNVNHDHPRIVESVPNEVSAVKGVTVVNVENEKAVGSEAAVTARSGTVKVTIEIGNGTGVASEQVEVVARNETAEVVIEIAIVVTGGVVEAVMSVAENVAVTEAEMIVVEVVMNVVAMTAVAAITNTVVATIGTEVVVVGDLVWNACIAWNISQEHRKKNYQQCEKSPKWI